MRPLGLVLIAIGAIGLLIAFNMNTTVEVRTPRTIGDYTFNETERVHNIGLMDERRNWLIVSGLVLVAGVLFFGFGALSEQGHMPVCGNTPQPQVDGTLGTVSSPVTVFTTLDSISISETPARAGFDEDNFARLCSGEPLPPKFDERGRPLVNAEQGGFAQFLESE